MPEMRKCKECGKLFQPKGREQYCSDIHYRPCPICGAPVEAKYLSDPPRRCANCKATNKIVSHSRMLFEIKDDNVEAETTSDVAEVSEDIMNGEQLNIDDIPPGKDIRRFIGKDYKRGKGFLPNHLYELTLDRDEYSYWITATYDWTSNKEVAITELFSSKISIDGHFEKLNQG